MRIGDTTLRLTMDISAFMIATKDASAAVDRLTLVLLRRRFADLLQQLLLRRIGG